MGKWSEQVYTIFGLVIFCNARADEDGQRVPAKDTEHGSCVLRPEIWGRGFNF